VTETKEKPPGCRKLFIGNLSYEIDDDTLVKFFEGCGTMTGLRWLTRKDTGEFRVRKIHMHCVIYTQDKRRLSYIFIAHSFFMLVLMPCIYLC
jgi:RNA recognition motif-containing protein